MCTRFRRDARSLDDDEEMWFNEDEDEDEADTGEKRVDEDFPETYGKYMGAKKGIQSILFLSLPSPDINDFFGKTLSPFLTHISYLVAVKESEDKENLPKRTATGSFKFTFSHSAGAANGTNGASSKPASSASPASPNGSSGKTAAALPSTPVVKVGLGCSNCTSHLLFRAKVI